LLRPCAFQVELSRRMRPKPSRAQQNTKLYYNQYLARRPPTPSVLATRAAGARLVAAAITERWLRHLPWPAASDAGNSHRCVIALGSWAATKSSIATQDRSSSDLCQLPNGYMGLSASLEVKLINRCLRANSQHPAVTPIELYCSASNAALVRGHDSLDFHVEWLQFAATQFDQLIPGE